MGYFLRRENTIEAYKFYGFPRQDLAEDEGERYFKDVKAFLDFVNENYKNILDISMNVRGASKDNNDLLIRFEVEYFYNRQGGNIVERVFNKKAGVISEIKKKGSRGLYKWIKKGKPQEE